MTNQDKTGGPSELEGLKGEKLAPFNPSSPEVVEMALSLLEVRLVVLVIEGASQPIGSRDGM